MQNTEISKEQVEAWKEQHGDNAVLRIEIKGTEIFILDPTKVKDYFNLFKRCIQYTLSGDLVSAGELVVNTCYLGGLGSKKEMDRTSQVYASLCFNCAKLLDVEEETFTKA